MSSQMSARKTEVCGLVDPEAVTQTVLGFPVLTVVTYCFLAPQFLEGLAKSQVNSELYQKSLY